jgi:hypothetical protein
MKKKKKKHYICYGMRYCDCTSQQYFCIDYINSYVQI